MWTIESEPIAARRGSAVKNVPQFFLSVGPRSSEWGRFDRVKTKRRLVSIASFAGNEQNETEEI